MLGRQNSDFSSRSPPFFFEPPKNFPAAGKLDFCPTKIFSSNENISVVWLNVLHAMFYLVQKVFKVWSKFIFNFVKYVFRFKYRNRRTVVDATINPESKGAIIKLFLILDYLPHIKRYAHLCNAFCVVCFTLLRRWCPFTLLLYAFAQMNEDSFQKLKQNLQTHSTVQPNCGEKSCLKRNAGGPNGWTILRPKVQRKPKPKKPKPKAPKRKVPPGGSPSGKKRKQGNWSKQL